VGPTSNCWDNSLVPRKNRRDSSRPPQLRVGGQQWTEQGKHGEWTVRVVREGAKDYVCPGCNQIIAQGSAHLVAWQPDSLLGAEARRHWHRPCWQRGAARR